MNDPAPNPQDEKRKMWEFAIVEGGPWRWRVTYPDGRKSASDHDFRTLKACVDDAKNYGYVYGIRRGVMMSDLVSDVRKAHPERREAVLRVPDSMKMLSLLRELVACNPENAELVRDLQRAARKVLGLAKDSPPPNPKARPARPVG